MGNESISKTDKKKKREPVLRTDHLSVDEIESEVGSYSADMFEPNVTSQEIEYAFADTFMREEQSGALPMLSLERPEETEFAEETQLVQPILDDTGSKSQRKEKQKQYDIDKAKYLADKAKQVQKQQQKDIYYGAASGEIADMIVKERVTDEFDMKSMAVVSDDQKTETKPYEWIQMKFTGPQYGDTDVTEDENRAAFYVQERIARSMTEARDIMMRERAKEKPDADRLNIYDSLSQRLILISNSYVLNEREIKTLDNIKQTEVDALTASVKAKIAEGDIPDEATTNALMASAMKRRTAVQKNLRQNLQLEIRKLTALLRRAELVTADQSTWADGEDLVYLEQIGVSSAMFNMLGWPEEVRRTNMSQQEIEEKYGSIFNRETNEERLTNRKEHDKIILKELGAEFDHYEKPELVVDTKEEVDSTETEETEVETADELADIAARQREEFMSKTILAYDKLESDDKRTDKRIDLIASAEDNPLCDEELRITFDNLIKREMNFVTDEIAKEMETELASAVERIEEILKSPEKKLSAKERIAYMNALDRALNAVRANLNKINEPASPDESLSPNMIARRNELRTSRIAAYEKRVILLEAKQEQYSLAKYNRAINRRTNTDYVLSDTAQDLQKKRLDKIELTKKQREDILLALESGETFDRAMLLRNLEAFLTGSMRAEIAGSLKVLKSGDDVEIGESDRLALHSAAHYILTTDDKKGLEEEFIKLSANTLLELEQRLLELKLPDEKDGKKPLTPEQKKATAFSIGDTLSALKFESEQTLLEKDLAKFEEERRQIAQSYISLMEVEIVGSEIKDPLMNRLLIEANMDPRLLQLYAALKQADREKFLADVKESPARAASAIDKLMIGRPDMDALALMLKTKALRGMFAEANTTEGEPELRELSTTDILKLNTSHDGSRLARACRSLAVDMANASLKGVALKKRKEELAALDDKQLVEKLLSESPNSDYSFLLINTYALLLSGETGMSIKGTDEENSISPEYLKDLPAFSALNLEDIRDALTSNMGSASQYKDVGGTLVSQSDVYDSESFGNRFKNYLGSVFGKDLSRERMGLWVLNSLSQSPGQYNAHELQLSLLRGIYGLNTANSIDALHTRNIAHMVEREKDAASEDRGHELAIAGRRLTSRKRLAENRKKRHSAERQVYDESLREGLNLVTQARETRHEAHEVTTPVKKEKRTAAAEATISNTSSIAMAVLTTDAFMNQAKAFLSGKDDKVSFKEGSLRKTYVKTGDGAGFKSYSDTAKAIRSTLDATATHHFDLSAMSTDENKHNDEEVQEDRQEFKGALDDFYKATTVGEAKKAIERYDAIKKKLNLLRRAEAALLMEEESGRDEKMKEAVATYSATFKGTLAKTMNVDGGVLAKHREGIVEKYNSAEAVRKANEAELANVESELTGTDILLNAREDRITYYGGKAGDNATGATLALTVLSIGYLLNRIITSTANDNAFLIKPKEVPEYKSAFDSLRGRLGWSFNLEAMTSESIFNMQSNSRVGEIREQYRELVDAFKQVKDDDIAGLKKTALNLKQFYDKYRLEDRAGAAVTVKDATQSFTKKLDNATGTNANVDGAIKQGMRAQMLMDYGSKLGTDVIDVEDPLKALSSKLKAQFSKTTEIVVLATFQNASGVMDFTAYMEQIKKPESAEYAVLHDLLARSFSDIKFAKKDKLPGESDSEGKYRPLQGEEGSLLAELMISEFIDKLDTETSASKQDAAAWLEEKSHKTISENSIMISLVRDKIGKKASSHFKEKLVVSGAVDKMIAQLKKGQVLTIQNFAGGGVGATAVISGLDVTAAVEGTAGNDLTVTRDFDGKFSIYVGGYMYGKIAASVGADAGPVNITGSAELSMTLAQGMKLDFAGEDKCKAFLIRFFNGGYSADDATELDAAMKSREMLKQADRIAPIRSIAGKVGVGVSVGTNDDTQDTITDGVKSLLGNVEFVAKAAAGVTAITDAVDAKLTSWGGTVAGWAQGAYDYLGPKIVNIAKSIISAAPDEAMASELSDKLDDAFAELATTVEEKIQEQIADRIKDLPSTIADKVSEKIKKAIVAKLVADFGAEEKGDDEKEPEERIDKIIAKIKSTAEEKLGEKIDSLLLTEDEIGKIKKEAEEKEKKEASLIDATLAAKMSVAGVYKSETDKDTEKITTTVQLDASAEGTLTIAGAELSKKAEGRFEAILERRFTGGKLTGATMSRRYIMDKSDSKHAKEILDGFGIQNDAILKDLKGELAGIEGVVLVFDAELTKEGLDKYQKAREEGSGLKDLFVLNDRNNYQSTLVRLEVPVTKESQKAAIRAKLKLKAMGTGGGVDMQYSSGAGGAIHQMYRYGAQKRKK